MSGIVTPREALPVALTGAEVSNWLRQTTKPKPYPGDVSVCHSHHLPGAPRPAVLPHTGGKSSPGCWPLIIWLPVWRGGSCWRGTGLSTFVLSSIKVVTPAYSFYEISQLPEPCKAFLFFGVLNTVFSGPQNQYLEEPVCARLQLSVTGTWRRR